MDKAECFLFIGTGNFHPLGVALATNKEVIIADPEKNEVRKASDIKDIILKQRYGAIQRAFNAKSFGILIGTMTFQRRFTVAKRLKNKIEEYNKKAFLMVGREFRPEEIAYMNIDAAVCTACPRIAIDDYLRYPIPIITPTELEIVLGERKLGDYAIDQIFGRSV
jgi:2-(3-amino-3-carboxypropyl)histidine synthase